MITLIINVNKCHSVTRHDIHPHSGQTSEDVRVGLNRRSDFRVQTRGTSRIATDFDRSTERKPWVFPPRVAEPLLFTAIFDGHKVERLSRILTAARTTDHLTPETAPSKCYWTLASENSSHRNEDTASSKLALPAASLGSVLVGFGCCTDTLRPCVKAS